MLFRSYTAEGPRPIKDLEIEFEKELHQQKPIVSYCGSGVTACNTMLVMSEVGLASALYVGSYSDWVTYDDFPIQTGVETL